MTDTSFGIADKYLLSILRNISDANRMGLRAVEVRCWAWPDAVLNYVTQILLDEGFEILPQRETWNVWFGFWVVWHNQLEKTWQEEEGEARKAYELGRAVKTR